MQRPQPRSDPDLMIRCEHTNPRMRYSHVLLSSLLSVTVRVLMGLTVNRQMTKKLTVNRQKRNIFNVK